MAKTCYMCDSKRTSYEHVPPKCLFPEQKDLPDGVDLRKDLITVPSCDVHNSKKSEDDEYILYVLLMNISNNDVAKNHFLTKLMRAIERNPSLFNKFIRRREPVVAHDTVRDEFQETMAVQIDYKRFCSSMEHMARALHFHHFKRKWSGSVSVYPDFLLSMHPVSARKTNEKIEKMAKAASFMFDGIECHGKNPDVFEYQVADGSNGVDKSMRLHFFGGARVTLFFNKQG